MRAKRNRSIAMFTSLLFIASCGTTSLLNASAKNNTDEKETFYYGDVNKDGVTDVLDVVALQKWILGVPDSNVYMTADIDQSGEIDIFDLGLLKQQLYIAEHPEVLERANNYLDSTLLYNNKKVNEKDLSLSEINQDLMMYTRAYGEKEGEEFNIDYGYYLVPRVLDDSEKMYDTLDIGFERIMFNDPKNGKYINNHIWKDGKIRYNNNADSIIEDSVIYNSNSGVNDSIVIDTDTLCSEMMSIIEYMTYQKNDKLALKKVRLALYEVELGDADKATGKQEVNRVFHKYIYVRIPYRINFDPYSLYTQLKDINNLKDGSVIYPECSGDSVRTVYGAVEEHRGFVRTIVDNPDSEDRIPKSSLKIVNKGLNVHVESNTRKRTLDDYTKTVIVFEDEAFSNYLSRNYEYDKLYDTASTIAKAMDKVGLKEKVEAAQKAVEEIDEQTIKVVSYNELENKMVLVLNGIDVFSNAIYIDFDNLTINCKNIRGGEGVNDLEFFELINSTRDEFAAKLDEYRNSDGYERSTYNTRSEKIAEIANDINKRTLESDDTASKEKTIDAISNIFIFENTNPANGVTSDVLMYDLYGISCYYFL